MFQSILQNPVPSSSYKRIVSTFPETPVAFPQSSTLSFITPDKLKVSLHTTRTHKCFGLKNRLMKTLYIFFSSQLFVFFPLPHWHVNHTTRAITAANICKYNNVALFELIYHSMRHSLTCLFFLSRLGGGTHMPQFRSTINYARKFAKARFTQKNGYGSKSVYLLMGKLCDI